MTEDLYPLRRCKEKQTTDIQIKMLKRKYSILTAWIKKVDDFTCESEGKV